MTNIRSYSIPEFEEKAREFHGFAAPGIMLGGFMVELAYRHLPEEGLFDSISETGKCLPDAIQILTPCSVGNGWLRIMDIGRYALTMYDKHSGEGVRVYVDTARLDDWPAIKDWFLNLKPKREQDTGQLLDEIKAAGTDICGYRKIKVKLPLLSDGRNPAYAICSKCGESHPADDGDLCLGCQGKLPYSS